MLIVGASSTGVQLADEIQRSGRQVTLAVGRHTRLPRRYRGRDILWWLDRLGVLLSQPMPLTECEPSRRRPSLQLVGRPDHASVDLGTLHKRGVRLVGRVRDIDGHRVGLADDLTATTAAADIKMADVLMRIDQFIGTTGAAATSPEVFRPTWPLAMHTADSLDLKAEQINTVIWATGYRRAYPWLGVPVLDARGEIDHAGGVTRVPGLYVLGLNFQRRRNSSFIDGVGADAQVIAQRIAGSMSRVQCCVAMNTGNSTPSSSEPAALERRPRCCSRGQGHACCWSTGRVRHRHAVDARADARRRPAAASLGRAARHRGGRHTAGALDDVQLSRTGRDRADRAEVSASARCTRRAGRCSTARWSTPRRRAERRSGTVFGSTM